MPTYVYECVKCGEVMEAFQRMSDEPLKDCEKCDGDLKKVFTPVGIMFKGSGFYCNDSRKSCVSATPPAEKKKEPACAASSPSDGGGKSACAGCDKAAPSTATT